MKKTRVQLVGSNGASVAYVTLPLRPDLPDELPRIMKLPDGRKFMRCDEKGVYKEMANEA